MSGRQEGWARTPAKRATGSVNERGYSDELVREKTLQSAAMHHRGVQVGHFFLAGKVDAPEFSAADEELLDSTACGASAGAARYGSGPNDCRPTPFRA